MAFAARRPGDEAARYGGEELAVILPCTDSAGTAFIAERLRASIELLQVPRIERASNRPIVTVSIGTATGLPAEIGGDSMPGVLLESADRALYRAKLEGRNRVKEGQCVARKSEG